MTPSSAPVTARMKGPAVANLQEALLWLIDHGALMRDDEAVRREYSAGLQQELAAGSFDPATSKVLERFQRQHHLRPSEAVHGPTAQALNTLLREFGAEGIKGSGVFSPRLHQLPIMQESLSRGNDERENATNEPIV